MSDTTIEQIQSKLVDVVDRMGSPLLELDTLAELLKNNNESLTAGIRVGVGLILEKIAKDMDSIHGDLWSVRATLEEEETP